MCAITRVNGVITRAGVVMTRGWVVASRVEGVSTRGAVVTGRALVVRVSWIDCHESWDGCPCLVLWFVRCRGVGVVTRAWVVALNNRRTTRDTLATTGDSPDPKDFFFRASRCNHGK
jgi:hypothetical protein